MLCANPLCFLSPYSSKSKSEQYKLVKIEAVWNFQKHHVSKNNKKISVATVILLSYRLTSGISSISALYIACVGMCVVQADHVQIRTKSSAAYKRTA